MRPPSQFTGENIPLSWLVTHLGVLFVELLEGFDVGDGDAAGQRVAELDDAKVGDGARGVAQELLVLVLRAAAARLAATAARLHLRPVPRQLLVPGESFQIPLLLGFFFNVFHRLHHATISLFHRTWVNFKSTNSM